MDQNQNQKQKNLEELAELSGETSLRQTKYTVPYLKFNGSTGKFALLTNDSEGKFIADEIAESEIEGIILKVRRAYTAYEKTQEGGTRYFSNEHNSFRDPIILFEKKTKEGRARMVAEGNLDTVRGKYPAIRLTQQLYFLYKGDVVKFGVKGKSLGAFWEYIESFGKDEHMFQFVTKIQRHQETNEGGLSYYVLDFIRGDEADLEEIGPKIKEVSQSLALQDKSFESVPKEKEENTGSPQKSEEEMKDENLQGTEGEKEPEGDDGETKNVKIPY